jgi:hypothetical protein
MFHYREFWTYEGRSSLSSTIPNSISAASVRRPPEEQYLRQVLHSFEVLLGQGGGTFELMTGDHCR